MGEGKGKSPAIFMGTDYYKVIQILMIRSAEANLTKDFSSWISILSQMYNITQPFMKEADKEELNKQLKNLFTQLTSAKSSKFDMILLQSILATERKLYGSIKELLVKTSEEEDDSKVNFSERVYGG